MQQDNVKSTSKAKKKKSQDMPRKAGAFWNEPNREKKKSSLALEIEERWNRGK